MAVLSQHDLEMHAGGMMGQDFHLIEHLTGDKPPSTAGFSSTGKFGFGPVGVANIVAHNSGTKSALTSQAGM